MMHIPLIIWSSYDTILHNMLVHSSFYDLYVCPPAFPKLFSFGATRAALMSARCLIAPSKSAAFACAYHQNLSQPLQTPSKIASKPPKTPRNASENASANGQTALSITFHTTRCFFGIASKSFRACMSSPRAASASKRCNVMAKGPKASAPCHFTSCLESYINHSNFYISPI